MTTYPIAIWFCVLPQWRGSGLRKFQARMMADSMVEAEYIIVSKAAKVVWIKKFIFELDVIPCSC